jgi:hypothetical protein
MTWFRWRGRDSDRRKTPSIVILEGPKLRPLRDTEVYSKLYYQDKLKSLVDAEIKGRVLTSAEKFSKRLEVTKWEWERETPDVKAHVQAKKVEMQKERNSKAKGTEPPTPKQCQAAIDELNHVAPAFLLHIKRTTGWTGFMVLGGQKPDAGTEFAVGS